MLRSFRRRIYRDRDLTRVFVPSSFPKDAVGAAVTGDVAMRMTIMSVLVAGVLLGAESHQSQKPSQGKKLWAAISESTPVRVWLVYSVDVFMIHFALANDGDKTVNPDVEAS